ncbi:MAG: ribonuclease [Gammaproteobacteria bacterium]|jgi:ribonuclease-3|nr:ribonuclease [Gammaproteobacteria bacterium]
MKADEKALLNQLCQKIGYFFNDSNLLYLALSHRSSEGPHNERLEFLGDAVLSLSIAEALYQKFPEAKEGELSRLRSSLVKGETLAVVAQEFNLGDYLRLGSGELKSGGYRRSSILEDAIEAIIGAIYLDSDFPTARAMVLAWFKSRIQALSLTDSLRDSKSRLQEYLQSKGYALPVYELVKAEGPDHAQIFTVRCMVKDLNLSAEAEGPSRRIADQEAAKALLALIELK